MRYHFARSRILSADKNGTKTLGGLDLIWYHFPDRGTNLVKRKGTKTMLIKFDVDESEASMMKAHYGQNVASKAFRMAAFDAVDLSRILREQKQEIAKLRQLLAVQKQTIDRAADSARALLDHVAQGDLING
jgi:hypothetical protein